MNAGGRGTYETAYRASATGAARGAGEGAHGAPAYGIPGGPDEDGNGHG